MGLQCPILLTNFLVCLLLLQLKADQTAVITMKQGKVIGTTFKLTNGQMAYKFLGIPYAEPPIGKNRFQEPKPSKWKGELNATKYKKDCPQKPKFFPADSGKHWDEDCLYLNVFTPMVPDQDEADLLPVMVYIHEGGFLEGSGKIQNPHKLMEKNVILITFNYRLGALGFLSTGRKDRTIAGNFGLFDQRKALVWVKDNIQNFGGNASSVTLFGCGAGGASAGLIMLSDQCEGLFSAAILQSGTALNWWAIRDKPEIVIKNLAIRLNCTVEPQSAMLQCLWDKPAEDFISVDYSINLLDLNEQLPRLPFAPVVDGTFITEDPSILLLKLERRDFPVIVGVVKDDASIYLITYEELQQTNYNVTEEFILKNLKAFDRGGIISEAVTTAIKFEYIDIKPENETNKWRKIAIELGSDAVFTAPAVRTIKKLIKHPTPVYMFTFEYETPNNSFNLDWLGAYQSSEKYYILGLPASATEIQKNISETISTYWTNFAKFGDPSPDDTITKWNAIKNEEKLVYLEITEKTQMKENYRKRKVSFWNEYIEKLYSITEHPHPPTEPAIIMEYNKFVIYQGMMILMTILAVLLMILLSGVLFHKYKGPPIRKISNTHRMSLEMINPVRKISHTVIDNLS